MPSRTATAPITSAAAGSAHHQPISAFKERPTSSAIDRYAQIMFWFDSLTAADEFSLCPMRRFARASSGIVGAVNAARPILTQLVAG